MLKKILYFLFIFCPSFVMADDCLDYKISPNISIKSPTWEKSVVQPLEPMDILHGKVIATMVGNYEITTDITSIEDGFCVALKKVDATIGYSDFMVQIDLSHKPNTCSYNAVLSHEDEHIRAYLSVIEDNENLLKKSVKSASESIMPVFVKNQSEIESAIDKLNNELQNHPDIVLLMQHLKAEEEIRNKRVDETDTGATLKKCSE